MRGANEGSSGVVGYVPRANGVCSCTENASCLLLLH